MKESECVWLIRHLFAVASRAENEWDWFEETVTNDERNAMREAEAIIRKLEEKESKAGTRIDYQAWLTYWNKNSGDLPKVRALTDKRKRSIKKLCDDVGHDEAWEAYKLAVKYVANDEFWNGDNERKTMYGFDNLVVHNKVMQKAEAADAESVGLLTGYSAKFDSGDTASYHGMKVTVAEHMADPMGQIKYRVRDAYGVHMWVYENEIH